MNQCFFEYEWGVLPGSVSPIFVPQDECQDCESPEVQAGQVIPDDCWDMYDDQSRVKPDEAARIWGEDEFICTYEQFEQLIAEELAHDPSLPSLLPSTACLTDLSLKATREWLSLINKNKNLRRKTEEVHNSWGVSSSILSKQISSMSELVINNQKTY
jgi:hypothetical protein